MAARERCDFDGGPFHDATIEIEYEDREDGELPPILVTDEGDYWVTYVLLDAHLRGQPTYSYDGSANESEIHRCPRVPSGNAIDGGVR